MSGPPSRVISAKSLMRLHVEALFTCDLSGRLVVVNEPRGGPAPRFFLGRTVEGNECWARHDLDVAVIRDLTALCASAPVGLEIEANPGSAAPFLSRLSKDEAVRKMWTGPAYQFPQDVTEVGDTVRVTPENAAVLTPYFEDWVADVQSEAPFAALLKDGKAVSICCSVRMTPRADEAGVETHPDFRGHGLAACVVAAWARSVREKERVPLYSTSWENQASRAVALKLGLVQYGADLHIT